MKLLVVLSCFLAVALGAIVNVTPFTACSSCGVQGVVFPNSTTYLMLTTDSVAWYSADEGQTWQRVRGSIEYFELSPADSQMVVLINTASVYTSTNGGATTTQVYPPITYISGVTMHPTQSSWLMAYNCAGLTCSTVYSKDFGKTWNNGPANLAHQYILWGQDTTFPDTVFAVRSDYTFGYTRDYGTTWTKLFSNALGWVMTDNYLYVGVATSSTSANLYSSSSKLDPTHSDPKYYYLDEFPSGNSLPEQGYTFLDDSSRSEFIAVKQPAGNNLWGTIYTSDFYGDQFALSLQYAAQTSLVYDFDRFQGIPGIFVANAYPTATSTTKQTYFSFDNGGDWNKLVAPKTNYLGIPTNCTLANGCSLHFHGLTSWYTGIFPPFYSSPNAIGLMIAVGNMGSALDANSANSKTYFTRDAGISWTELYNQPTIYEFGDHGGILVFAPISTPTTFVYYSLDEGKTLNTATFSQTSMYVDNIFIEPQGTGKKFVLLGHTGSSVNIKYYIFGLDFSGLNLPICQASDYENWSPQNDDYVNNGCFLGEQVIYVRRKQDSQCYNPEMDHKLPGTPCLCAWEDYECDVGFSPSARNASDMFTCTATHDVPTCATGYRKIPDTMCMGGLNMDSVSCPGYSGTPTTGYNPTTNPSSTTTPSGSTTGEHKEGSHTGSVVAIVLVFLIIFGGAGAIGFMYYKNENFREWVLSKLSRSPSQGYGRVNTDENEEEAAGSNTVDN